MNNIDDFKWPLGTRILHWLSVLFIFGLFGLGYWMRTLDYYHSWYQQAPDLHKSLGMIFVFILLTRLVWRFISVTPKHLENHKAWEIKLAKAMHRILYLGIIIIVVSGYLIATSENRGIEIFGIFNFPSIITAIEDQEDIAGVIHEWAAYALLAFVGLHAAGALKHHFFDKDKTLKRML